MNGLWPFIFILFGFMWGCLAGETAFLYGLMLFILMVVAQIMLHLKLF